MGNSGGDTEASALRETTVERFGLGESADDLETGFIVLTHGEYWTSRMIRFGQRLRLRGSRSRFARWNHVALVLGHRWQSRLPQAAGLHDAADLAEYFSVDVER